MFFFSLDGGELFSRIQDRGDQAFTERGREGLLWVDRAVGNCRVFAGLAPRSGCGCCRLRLTAGSISLPQLWATSELLSVADELVGVGGRSCTGGLVCRASGPLPVCVSLSPTEASEIMKSIGEAIQYLHSINIAHRDVKVLPVYTP